MPLGMLYTIAHLASLAGIAPESPSCATGSNARLSLDCGLLRAGKAADVVLIDAPTAARSVTRCRRSATAILRGRGVISGGEPRFVGAVAIRRRRHETCASPSALPRDFSGARH